MVRFNDPILHKSDLGDMPVKTDRPPLLPTDPGNKSYGPSTLPLCRSAPPCPAPPRPERPNKRMRPCTYCVATVNQSNHPHHETPVSYTVWRPRGGSHCQFNLLILAELVFPVRDRRGRAELGPHARRLHVLRARLLRRLLHRRNSASVGPTDPHLRRDWTDPHLRPAALRMRNRTPIAPAPLTVDADGRCATRGDSGTQK
jgi:hypothetical protein